VAPRPPGVLAVEAYAADPAAVDAKAAWFVPRCSLCRACELACPERVPITEFVIATRAHLIEAGALRTDAYRAMWVDYDWNAITLYRDTYKGAGCAGTDAAAAAVAEGAGAEGRIAFLPGCSLLNEAPELVEPVLGWLRAHLGEPVALETGCCGMPLHEMGLLDRAEAFEGGLVEKLRERGMQTLVLACPNCVGRLAQRGEAAGLHVTTVYELMARAGVRAPVTGDATLTIHDSCPARGTRMGAWVRELLADWRIVEMEHHGDCSICCGSGGAVGMFDPTLHDVRAERRVAEFEQTGAQLCATYCMSSCSTLHRGSATGKMRHVLELVFGRQVDHAAYQQRVQAMWEGEWGAYNSYRLSNAKALNTGDADGRLR
jgi:Fe-S oxidoreductase